MTWAGGLRWSGSEPAWLGFFAALTNGRILLRHELRFLDKTPEEACDEIAASMTKWKIPKLDYVAANPEIFPNENAPGESISETFMLGDVPVIQGTNNREHGLSRLRSWLVVRTWPDGAIEPSLTVHPDCRYFIRTLPTLLKDPERPEDILKTVRSYPVEGTMHYAMSRPSPITEAREKPLPPGAIGHIVEEMRRDAERSKYGL